MKCKECQYHEDDNVCREHCGLGKNTSGNGKRCFEERIRQGMDENACVYNCSFCKDNRMKKGIS